MNAKDREVQYNIYHLLEKLERHQEVQNEHILENMRSTTSNTTWRRVHTWVIGIILAGFAVLINRIW